jgi:hypothetical protein
MTLKPSQQGYIAGCNVNLAINTTCATSTDGSVVGIQNPLTATVNTTSGAGSLGPGTYYTVYEWYDSVGNVTLASPETIKTLSATGSLVVNPPASGIPALAVGMDVFIGTTSGGETLQGQTVGSASFVQSAALTSGASPASSNTTLCHVTANDTIWPTGTGYNVSLVDSVGNPIPQYPMQWQLLGPGTTINLSNGLPYYHGTVFYPIPILANPANHGTQSISGTLDLGGYFLRNVARVGVGTSTPAWGIDVEGTGLNGLINSKGGYLANGSGGTSGQCLASDGTAFNTVADCITSLPNFYYQTILNGSHVADAVAQEPYLAVGTGSGLVATSIIGVGTQVGRTVLSVNATGDLSTGGEIVNAIAPGTTGNCMKWNAGMADDAGGPCTTVIASRTCNFSGCYRIDGDGTIQQWGSATTTTNSCSGDTFSFPTSFTTTSNLSLTLQAVGSVSHFMTTASKGTTSFVAYSRDLSNDCDSGQVFDWYAIGH